MHLNILCQGGAHLLKIGDGVDWTHWPPFVNSLSPTDSHFVFFSLDHIHLCKKFTTNFQQSLTQWPPFLIKFLSKMCPNLYFGKKIDQKCFFFLSCWAVQATTSQASWPQVNFLLFGLLTEWLPFCRRKPLTKRHLLLSHCLIVPIPGPHHFQS